MKKLLLFLYFLVFMVSCLYSQERYKVVNCETYISIRKTKSTSAPVLGRLLLHEYVYVYKIEGKWATIKYEGKDAYVLASYLKHSPPPKELSKERKYLKGIENKLNGWKGYFGNTKWALWLIVPLIVLMFYLSAEKEWDIAKARWLSLVILALTVFEGIYMFGSQEFSWFCRDPRWYWIALNFVAFAVCAYYQYCGYIYYCRIVSDNKISIGIYSWIAAIIAAIILHFTDYPPEWALLVCFVGQLIQLGIISAAMTRHSSLLEAMVHCAIYLAFTLATLVVLLQFLALLVIVLLGLLVLGILGSSSGSSSYSTPSDEKKEEPFYETADGARLYEEGPYQWRDSYGRRWEGGFMGSDLKRVD